jgi:BASS family bile acid:Na+ symporter
MTEILLPLAIAFILFTLGLGLTLEDFRRVIVIPRGVTIGLVNLIILSPLMAFGMAKLFNLDPLMAVGLVLLGASPGGALANMLTHLAKGETALSVTMTAISSITSVITIPLFFSLANDYFGAGGSLSVGDMWTVVLRTFMITVVPLSIGMYVRSRSPEWVERTRSTISKYAIAVFVLVVLGAVASEWSLIRENFARVAAAALALNLLAMTVSFSLSKAARLSDRQATAIALELGVHNGTVAIAVATIISSVSPDIGKELVIPAAVYSLFQFLTGGTFAWLMARRNARNASEDRVTAEAA